MTAMDAGTLFRYNKHVLEACISKDNACSGCAGLTEQVSCKNFHPAPAAGISGGCRPLKYARQSGTIEKSKNITNHKTENMTVTNTPLRIAETESDVIEIYLTEEKTPAAYQRKKQELVKFSGMTEQEAERYLLRTPIPLELFYDTGKGMFGVESDTIESCDIYNPYTGKEIPNGNLPPAASDPLKFLDASIGILMDMSGDLRTEVYDKYDFSNGHMEYIEEAIGLIGEAADRLNDINLTEEREKAASSKNN